MVCVLWISVTDLKVLDVYLPQQLKRPYAVLYIVIKPFRNNCFGWMKTITFPAPPSIAFRKTSHTIFEKPLAFCLPGYWNLVLCYIYSIYYRWLLAYNVDRCLMLNLILILIVWAHPTAFGCIMQQLCARKKRKKTECFCKTSWWQIWMYNDVGIINIG